MEKGRIKGIVEAILFSTGRVVKMKELMTILELSSDEIIKIIESLQEDYSKEDRGLEIVRVEEHQKKNITNFYILLLIKD